MIIWILITSIDCIHRPCVHLHSLFSIVIRCLIDDVIYWNISKSCIENPLAANVLNVTVLKFFRHILLDTNVMVSLCGQIMIFL